ncbi:MAG: serine/threonine-protein kinase [Rubripirellula sp.]
MSSEDEAPTEAFNPAETTASLSAGSLIGTRIGDFQVMRKLGRGGMADVYAARQLTLERDVALKVLRSEFALDKDYIQRFRREARAAARLNDPNIVQVYDVGSVDAIHYIAQELIDGQNLREVLDRDGALSLEDGIEVLVGVASALRVAAEAGITHRDIKPENIMRTSRGVIKVADFGLARLGSDMGATQANLTQAGLTLGTPRYMSPEQVQGQSVDVRSDLYSLGVSMYHLLSGRPPFEADDPLALAFMHLHETPKPLDRARNRKDDKGNPDLPEWMIAVISRLMSKLPKDRFQSPSELLDAVQNETAISSIGGFGVGTAAATIRLQRATEQVLRGKRRRIWRVAAMILLPLACAAGAAVGVVSGMKAPSVSGVLRPETVVKEDTVQEQFLQAVVLNYESGWQAVGQYFPPEDSSINAGYYAKSQLQLAAFLQEDKRYPESEKTLDELLNRPNVDRFYQVIALARRYFLLEEMGRMKKANEAKQQLQGLFAELKSNPSKVRMIETVLTGSERLQLGIGDS